MIYPILMVNLVADVEMVSGSKKKQQNSRLFSQLSERHTDFMIRQIYQMSKPKIEITCYVEVLLQTMQATVLKLITHK